MIQNHNISPEINICFRPKIPICSICSMVIAAEVASVKLLRPWNHMEYKILLLVYKVVLATME